MANKTKKKKLVIEWPETAFTVMDIQALHSSAKEITLRFRINKAISDGDIVYIGKIPRDVGRPHIVFAKTPVNPEVLQKAQSERGVVLDEQFEQNLVDVAKVDSSTQSTTEEVTTETTTKQTVS